MNGFSWSSGKGGGDENFPVASMLIAGRHRPVVTAFYRVARMADDVADHPSAAAAAKLGRLAAIEAGLRGRETTVPEAVALRQALIERNLTDEHILDLLSAFRMDVEKSRYADWNELMAYCRLSAAPVGRFVLDLHGESRGLWPLSDGLCAALQVINHLQDCAADYRDLDRVYIPLDRLAAEGLEPTVLGAPRASDALRRVVSALSDKCAALLAEARSLARSVADVRLGLEVAVIQRLAESLTLRLARRDPLSERVHHRKIEAAGLATQSICAALVARLHSARRPPLGIEAG